MKVKDAMPAQNASTPAGQLRAPTERDLRRLARFRSPQGVLSVYLSFAAAEGERRDLRAVALDVLHTLGGTARERLEGRLDEERRGLIDFLNGDFELGGRSVSSSVAGRGPGDIFQQMPVAPLARFAERPVIAPLAALLDVHERYAVALVDKDRARLLHVYLGRVEREVDVVDEYPGRSKMGGWSEARYSHHRDAHLHVHLLRAAHQLREEARRWPFDRLLIGGPDEARAAFVAVLLAASNASPGRLARSSSCLVNHRTRPRDGHRDGWTSSCFDILDAAVGHWRPPVGRHLASPGRRARPQACRSDGTSGERERVSSRGLRLNRKAEPLPCLRPTAPACTGSGGMGG
jgi:hypothetical protein